MRVAVFLVASKTDGDICTKELHDTLTISSLWQADISIEFLD